MATNDTGKPFAGVMVLCTSKAILESYILLEYRSYKGGQLVALYRYTAAMSTREDHTEKGTVRAVSEKDAKKKLKALRFDRIHIRKVNGLRSVFGQLTATIK